MNSPASDNSDCQCPFNELTATVRRLRDPEGCPWDAEQTHLSLRPNLLEEAYETLEAIEEGDTDALEEELGDLLIQIVFHSDIASRNGDFNADSVCRKVMEKLIRRHPHVFGTAEKLDSGEDVIDRWERIKREEAGGYRSIVASVPQALPALAQSAVLQRRTIRAGLDIETESDVLSEMAARGPKESDDDYELRAGKLLMQTVRAIQAQGIDPETALRRANRTLRDQVLRAEDMAQDTALAELPEAERSRIWQMATD